MRHVNRTLLPAAVFLAAAFGAGLSGAAAAQGEDAVEAEVAEDGDEEFFEDDASGVFDQAEAPAEDPAEEAAPPATAAPATGGEELVAPGSTEESDPGGSTKPGTRPDD